MTLKLMVGIPSHSGTIVMDCASTLLMAQKIAMARGGSFEFRYHSGATISLVRNAMVAEFLRSDSEILLMLDSDQAIGRVGIERLIDLDKPVVGCLYPMRRYNWDRVKRPTEEDPALVTAQALEFVGYLQTDENGKASVENGFARAEHVGTGVMLVRRQVFEQLMTHFPELEGVGFGPDAYPDLSPNWGFFNPLTTELGLPLSEDISFCRRWRTIGGEIWADLATNVAHIGQHTFRGNYINSWQAIHGTGSE
jgi:hypothetical protein